MVRNRRLKRAHPINLDPSVENSRQSISQDTADKDDSTIGPPEKKELKLGAIDSDNEDAESVVDLKHVLEGEHASLSDDELAKKIDKTAKVREKRIDVIY